MASSNINKIMRNHMNLKPWLLSKNTTEIVNKCIQQIYKQTPNNFKNELLQVKTHQAKPENKAPIRSFRSQERLRMPVKVTPRDKNRVSNLNGERLLNAAMMHNKRGGIVASLVGNKKLLKSPNYKIYGSRRFGSSASSSNASIYRRLDERRRSRTKQQTSQLNYLMRSLGTQGGTPKTLGFSSAMARFPVPARNQHMESRVSTVPNPLLVSSGIQGDLMQIDATLKNRISLGRQRTLAQPLNRLNSADPMDGWHHPPPLFLARLNERFIASAELHEQQRGIRLVNKLKSELHLRQDAKLPLMSNPLPGSHKLNRQRISNVYNNKAKERLMRTQQNILEEKRHSRSQRFGSHRSLALSGGESTKETVALAQGELSELPTTTAECNESVLTPTAEAATTPTEINTQPMLIEHVESTAPILLEESTKPLNNITTPSKATTTPKVSAIPRLTAEPKVKANEVSVARAIPAKNKSTDTATSMAATKSLTQSPYSQGRYNHSSYHNNNMKK